MRKAIEAGFFLFASEIDNFPDLPLSVCYCIYFSIRILLSSFSSFYHYFLGDILFDLILSSMQERCLLNLELCGPKRNPNSEGEDGGRIILDQVFFFFLSLFEEW